MYADSSSDLISTLGNNSAVSRIILKAGTYEFDDNMCSDERGSALCIDRNVTIEAEVAGSVVLNAKGARRVIYVSAAGRAELVRLNITGGQADHVSFSACTALNELISIAPLYMELDLALAARRAAVSLANRAAASESTEWLTLKAATSMTTLLLMCLHLKLSLNFHPSPP